MTVLFILLPTRLARHLTALTDRGQSPTLAETTRQSLSDQILEGMRADWAARQLDRSRGSMTDVPAPLPAEPAPRYSEAPKPQAPPEPFAYSLQTALLKLLAFWPLGARWTLATAGQLNIATRRRHTVRPWVLLGLGLFGVLIIFSLYWLYAEVAS